MKKAFKIISFVLCFMLLFDLPAYVFAQSENDRNTAYVVLADNATMHNITQVSMGTNSMVTVVEKNSKKGWQLNSASTTSAYLNIDLPDSFSNAKEEGTEYVVEVDYFDTETAELKNTEMYIDGFKAKLEKDTSYKGLWTVSFTLKEF